MSKILPNTTQTPNLYLDKLMVLLDEGELKTLLYAVRRTMGFHKGSDHISISQFMNGNGRVDENGEPLEYGTGLSKSTQIAVLKRLVGFGLLVEMSPNISNQGAEWALQMEDHKVQWNALWARHDQRKNATRTRTQHGRVAASAKRQQGGLFIEPPEGGLSIRPLVVQPLDPQVVYPLDLQKKDRKPARNKDRKVASESDQSVELVWGELLAFCEGEKETAVKIWQLQVAYSEKSLIPRPDIDTKHGRKELADSWWPALRDVLNACGGDVERAIAGLGEGIASQSDWKAESVSTPASVRKKTLAKIAALQRGVNGNGHGQQMAYATYTI